MRRFPAFLLALTLLVGLAAPGWAAEGRFYTDVPAGEWYAPAVRTLFDERVLPGGETFGAYRTVTRLEFVRYLYRLHKALGGEGKRYDGPSAYTDVAADKSEGFQAVMWARESQVANGVSGSRFDPDALLSREQCCTMLCRFAAAENIRVPKKAEGTMFRDSMRVSGFARSAVVACRMAGFLTGYSDGTVAPGSSVIRCEAAVMLERLYKAAKDESAKEGTEYVSLDPKAYLSLYDRYRYTFGEPVAESEPVDKSWFDSAVFIGDSVTVRLQMYCGSTNALGDATFLCTTSLDANTALMEVTDWSLHPTYQGRKVKVEEGVAACGARNVYIMLGINNMRSAVESSTGTLVTLIGKIKERAPGVNILIQSVTPMAATSTIITDAINNRKIDQYNARMRELCAQNGWYYLDVASRFKDADGNLKAECCSDPWSMGIHFTSTAAGEWCDYLKGHVPEALKLESVPKAPADRVEEPPQAEPEPEMERGLSLEAACKAMAADKEDEEPLLLDEEAVCDLYGIEPEWARECAGVIVMAGVFPDEIVLVEAVDEAAAELVAAALRDKLDTVLYQAELYDAESYEKAQACRVVTEGLLVRLILSGRQEEYIAAWERWLESADRAP